MSIFRQDLVDDERFCSHGINCTALRERLNSNALEWATFARVQTDRAVHAKLSEDDLQILQAKVDKALVLHSARKITEAAQIYEDVLDVNPLHWECLTNLAKISSAQGHYEKSLSLFERALACRPMRDDTVYYLGHVLFKLNKHERAESIFRQVIVKLEKIRSGGGVRARCHDDGMYLDAMAMRGLCLQYLGRQLEAKKVYAEVLKHKPDHVQTLCHVCAMKSAMGLSLEAATEHAKLIALDPSHSRQACAYLDALFPKHSGIIQHNKPPEERWEPPKEVLVSSSFSRVVSNFPRLTRRRWPARVLYALRAALNSRDHPQLRPTRPLLQHSFRSVS
jgi:tetratricopeptide (TPR) repeat protein